MTREKALSIKKEIEDLCERHGLWVDSTNRKQPQLAMVELNIKIKVDKK